MSIDAELLFTKKQIRKDLIYIKSFCEKRNILPSLKNFLEYKKENSNIPECIYFFFGNNYCHYFFYSSKKFHSFFYSLPLDFQKDIGNIKKILLLLKTKPEINEYIKSILKRDMVI